MSMDFPGPWVGGFGILAIVWFVVVIGFWALVIVGLVYGVRWLVRADRNSRLPGPGGSGAAAHPEDPLEVLRHRYARGEIDEEEYERRRKTLGGT